MSRYTYTLNQNQKTEEHTTYKRKDLEKMTLFHLREICRKERVVVPSAQSADREGLIRLIMRFRGQKEYRHINTAQEGGLERLQEFVQNNKVHITDKQQIRIPGTITLYQETGMNELDGYKVQSDNKLYEGNLILIDELFQIYTCFYIQEVKGSYYLYDHWKNISILSFTCQTNGILNFSMIVTMEIVYRFQVMWRESGFHCWIYRKRRL